MPSADAYDLKPGETELQGGWMDLGSRVVWDETSARIAYLVRTRLESVATADDGWSHLFRDPADGRLWQLTYPDGTRDRSAPRKLSVMAPADAARKYRVNLG